MDKNALKVLYRLHKSGYKAFLVGGSVRDLLLNRRPKDFDVATDARPHKIKKLFRNSFLIGRRFRLVHVKFKDSIIEVSTFRKATPVELKSIQSKSKTSSQNTFGSPKEDAYRRDFTINALFYNIADYSIIDYTGGLKDLQAGMIRAIGDPLDRFEEDPVRMLRAVRAAARVGFGIERNTFDVILEQHHLITTASPPRILEELLVLLKMGSAGRSIQLLHKTFLLRSLIPEVDNLLSNADRKQSIDFFQHFKALDNLTAIEGEQTGQVLWGTLILACLKLIHPTNKAFLKHSVIQERVFREMFDVMTEFGSRYSIPRKQRAIIRAVLLDFHYFLLPRVRARIFHRILQQPYLDDALRLLYIHCWTTGKMYSYNRWKHTISRRKNRV